MLSTLLLNLSTDKYKHNELEQVFDQIAIQFLRNTKLVSGKNYYVIKEIEFYFISDHYRHIDPFISENKRRLLFALWHFHNFKSLDSPYRIRTFKSYQREKFKGVDITFGNKRHNNYGGITILKIETIRANENSNFYLPHTVNGVGNVVSAIMTDIGEDAFKKVANDETPMQAFEKHCPLHLEVFEHSLNIPIFKTVRKELGDPTWNEMKFFEKKYNYFNNENYKLVAP